MLTADGVDTSTGFESTSYAFSFDSDKVVEIVVDFIGIGNGLLLPLSRLFSVDVFLAEIVEVRLYRDVVVRKAFLCCGIVVVRIATDVLFVSVFRKYRRRSMRSHVILPLFLMLIKLFAHSISLSYLKSNYS